MQDVRRFYIGFVTAVEVFEEANRGGYVMWLGGGPYQ